MHRIWFFALSFLFLSVSGLSQSTSSEPQGMQALVAEVRELRKDLQATNGYALRAQVLLYRLQVQEGTVARVSQLLNDLRSKLVEAQDHRTHLAAAMKTNEELLDNAELSPASRKETQAMISRIKIELEAVSAQEQQAQGAETEAQDQLRIEQAKLSGLEDKVDRLERDLTSSPH